MTTPANQPTTPPAEARDPIREFAGALRNLAEDVRVGKTRHVLLHPCDAHRIADMLDSLAAARAALAACEAALTEISRTADDVWRMRGLAAAALADAGRAKDGTP